MTIILSMDEIYRDEERADRIEVAPKEMLPS